MIADDGRVGAARLELLQSPIHRGDELGALRVLARRDRVHAADPERALRHPEMVRQPEAVEHVAAFEIAGDEGVDLLRLHRAYAIDERRLPDRVEALLR